MSSLLARSTIFKLSKSADTQPRRAERWEHSYLQNICSIVSSDGDFESCNGSDSVPPAEYVLLSWSTDLFDYDTERISLQFIIRISHPNYLHLKHCIAYLEALYPASSSTTVPVIRTVVDDLRKRERSAQLHPSFAILFKSIHDLYHTTRSNRLPPRHTARATAEYDLSSLLDYIISGIHLWLGDAPTLLPLDVRSQSRTSSPLVLFLAYMSQRVETAFTVPIACETDLVPADDPHMQSAGWQHGYPPDYHFRASPPHDGYPLCICPATYLTLRKARGAHGDVENCEVWVSSMTFGLLEAVTRMRIPQALLTVRLETEELSEGITMLSGTRILRLLLGWRSRLLRPTQYDGYPSLADVVPERGREVARLLELVLGRLISEHPPIPLAARCTAMLMLVPLWSIARDVWGYPELPLDAFYVRLNRGILIHQTVSDFCRTEMRLRGWCPYTTKSLRLHFQPLTVSSCLLRLRPFFRERPDEHAECDEDRCRFYHIADTSAYVPRHVDPTCRCERIKPSLERVKHFLEAGSVPIVEYKEGALAVSASSEGAYVAISHVWADGMGSTTEEGLPVCVVERISSLVSGLLPGSARFWMDSLCVPEDRPLRKTAIRRMKDTYVDATKVLVLDVGIRHRCSIANPWEENLLMIAASGWMRRIWTLQEGLLARELWFEFADGVVHVEERIGTRGPDKAPVPPWEVVFPRYGHFELSLQAVPLFESRAMDVKPENLALIGIAGLAWYRDTTKAEDELVALSGLFAPHILESGRGFQDIGGPDAARMRMREFLLRSRKVPRGIPTYRMPRLGLPGFSWAPRSLTKMSGVPVEGTGICTEDGLLANYWIGTFKQPIRPSNGRQSGHSATDVQLSISIRYRAGKGPARYYALEPFTFVEGTDCLAILVLDEQFGAKTGDKVLRCAVVGDGGPERFVPDKRAFVRPFSFVDASVLLEIPASAIQSVAGKRPVQMCDMSELSSSWVLLK